MKTEEKAKEIEKRFGLQERSKPNSSGHFYTAICSNDKEEIFTLKIINTDNQEIETKFINEIKTHELFQKEKLTIDLPEVISADISQKPIWFLYKYIAGKTLGTWHKFEEENNLVEKIIKIPEEISKIEIKKELSESLPDKTKESENYLIKLLKKNQVGKLIDTEKLRKNFYSAQENIKENKNQKILIHGDLTPSNIIQQPDNSIAVIDWFEVGIGHFGYDFAFLYLILWSKNSKQKEFEEKFFKSHNQDQQDLFKLHTDLLNPKMILVLTDLIDNLKNLKGRQDFEEKELEDFENGIINLTEK